MKWYQPTNPNEVLEKPWLGESVIKYLESIIQSDFKILEHGAGGSTLWFAKHASLVVSIENNEGWYNALSQKVPRNVLLIFNKSGGMPKEIIQYKYPFDLLMIDGEPVEDRIFYINECQQLVKKGGYVVLDNANRPEYENQREYLHSISQSVSTFNSNDGTKYLITDVCRLL